MNSYIPTIGLEVHAQLKTNTKLFCSCKNEFGAVPNSNVCPVCLALPGALPVLSEGAVKQAIKVALALNAHIHQISEFSRKNYFYPDLPKGYQISQFDKPIATEGYLEIEVDGEVRKIELTRIHMEEDAGKLLHSDNMNTVDGSLVDLNRAGVPLVEIVSEPCIRNPKEAAEYVRALRQILRYIDACDGNLEEGSMRCDANVSIRPQGQNKLGVKVEIKNMNSFKHIQKAIEYEIQRQSLILDQGKAIQQETRLWNPDKEVTVSMRSKENAHDYRYFPDPDLKPLRIPDDWIPTLREHLSELPRARRSRFESELGLSAYDSGQLTQESFIADYFENCLKLYDDKMSSDSAKKVSNFILSEVLRVSKDLSIDHTHIAELLLLVRDGTINGKIAKEVLDEMVQTRATPKSIVEKNGWSQLADTDAIRKVIQTIVAENPNQVQQFKEGKDKLFGFFVGQIMKETQGKANPALVNQLLKEELAK